LIVGEYTTVEWKAGNVVVEKGKTVSNFGTFLADSPGSTMGNNGAAADKWTFENRNILNLGKGKFQNADQKKVGAGAREFKISSASIGTDLFEIEGTFTHDVAGAALSVESGTLKVTGTFTQSAGSVTVADGTAMEVTDAYTLSGGTVSLEGEVTGSGVSLTVGSFAQSGGTALVQYATMTSATDATLSGGTLTIAGGTLEVASNVNVQSGGTLTGVGTVDVSSGALVNAGTLSVGGVTVVPNANPIGALSVVGNYTQTSGGVLDLAIFSGNEYDRLLVSGVATLAGALNVTLFSGATEPQPGDILSVVTYGSRSGTFAALNLPTLSGGTWDPRYDDPLYPHALSLWVQM
jgi:hypothetical protein